MSAEIECGLRAGQQAVPLEGVRIDARLTGACIEVTVTQRYRNRETVPVEAVYVFPLQESAAVCGFAALIAGELVRGSVVERERAFERYDDAMMQGDGAFLLEQERPNVFTASVGNLRPGESVELQIRYVALAAREGDALRLAIPTTVSPRYVPQAAPEVGQPQGERVNPPHWPSVPYGLRLSVEVAGNDLKRVESPSHPVRVELRDEGSSVELASDDVALDRDFVLLVERRRAREPEARVAREADGRRVAMVTFLPDAVAPGERGHELLFLLDCSGSMDGDSIEQARRALALCVRALGSEDTFNVVRFGSSFESLWRSPQRFDDETLEQATRYIERSAANLGGTEILAPLSELLQQKRDDARPRRVLLLTDGQVGNEHDVLELARKHAGGARIFAFGIGAGASEHLVRGTARASRGAAEMIFPGERIEPKVLRMFERVRMPALDDAAIDWKGLRVEQAPSRIPPVFACDPLTIFARIEDGTASELELTAGGQRWRVAIDLERAEAGGPIPVLWAREAIRELDDESAPRRGSAQQRPEVEQKRRSRLIELGTRYQLLNSATSFVAVAERAAADRTTSPAELRRIPVALTTGWGGDDRTLRAPGAHPVTMPPRFVLASAPAGAAPIATGFAPFAARARSAHEPPGLGRTHESLHALARESASAPARAPAPSDRLYDLLMTQRADGTFPRSPALIAWLGPDRKQRLDAALKANTDERLVLTALVVLLLERECSDRVAEWKPALAKARAWLGKQAASFDAAPIVAA
jgi:Ca-activated chloride channel homolog